MQSPLGGNRPAGRRRVRLAGPPASRGRGLHAGGLRVRVSGKLPVDLGVPPLQIRILTESGAISEASISGARFLAPSEGEPLV